MLLQIGIVNQAQRKDTQDLVVYSTRLNTIFIGDSAPWHGLLARIPIADINTGLKVLFQQYIAAIGNRCAEMQSGEQWFCPFELAEHHSSGLVIGRKDDTFQVSVASTDRAVWDTPDGFPGLKINAPDSQFWVQAHLIPITRLSQELERSETCVSIISQEDIHWLLNSSSLLHIGVLDEMRNPTHDDIIVFDQELKIAYICDSYYWFEVLNQQTGNAYEAATAKTLLREFLEKYIAVIYRRCKQMSAGQHLFCPFDLSDEYCRGLMIKKGQGTFQIRQGYIKDLSPWNISMPDGFPGVEITEESSDMVLTSPPYELSSAQWTEKLAASEKAIKIANPKDLKWLLNARNY